MGFVVATDVEHDHGDGAGAVRFGARGYTIARLLDPVGYPGRDVQNIDIRRIDVIVAPPLLLAASKKSSNIGFKMAESEEVLSMPVTGFG
jgi:hypothetical protein